MKTVAINLISFSNTKSVGTFVFTKRILCELFVRYLNDFLFVIYIQKGILCDDFCIPSKANIKIVRVPKFRSSAHRIIFEQTLFYFYLKECDVFFTPSLSLPLFAPGKKILTIHDMIPFWDKNKYSFIIRHYVILMTRWTTKFSDAVVTVSESSKQDIIKYLNIKSEKVHVIYNFILNSENVIIKRNPQEAKLKINDGINLRLDVPFFLTVSTLQPAKNIDGLIKAFALFKKNNPSYYLYIVGNKGWNYNGLFDLVKQNNMEKYVIFPGYLDDSLLSILYSYCKGIVYVSFYEGFGIPPLEGFYHGKVCVASNISSIPEVVGNAGYLVDPYDINSIAKGMELLTIDVENRSRFIPEQLEKFVPENQIKKLIDLFN